MMYELVMSDLNPNVSYSSLGDTVHILGLTTGNRVGVSIVFPELEVNLPMRASPSLLMISNMSKGIG